MKIRKHLRLLILTLAVTSLALPVAALAHCKKSCMGKSGVVYNETDGRYYPVPSAKRNMVYRVVDGRYVPVRTYSSYCAKHHSCKTMVSVRCQTRPGYWWQTTWMPTSQECYYMVR